MNDTSTQLTPVELRLAAVFTGGVSLAVWMGGVAREMNLLTQAHANATDGGQVRAKYRELLELLRLDVRLDVLSGTSAGGINAACLGLANARGSDLGGLRDLWLDEGALGGLLRSPSEPAPPSLLKGDDVLLTGLRKALEGLPSPHGAASPTHVFITTTLLDGVQRTFRDDYGTAVRDVDHHGLFTFAPEDLAKDGVQDALALAARASASFPVAFEPAYVPVGTARPASHPDMSAYLAAGCATQFCADGGLLANRPLGPALQAIFDRPAGKEVRRVLTYVVPCVGTPPVRHAAQATGVPGMGPALLRDLDAALSQTVSGELKALADHNDRVTARRRREEWLVRLVPPDDATTEDEMYAQYRDGWIHDHARSAAQRNLARTTGRRARNQRPAGYGSDLEDLAHTIGAALRANIPMTLPAPDAPDLYGTLARFGLAPLDGARATVLGVLHDARGKASPGIRGTLDGLAAQVLENAGNRPGQGPGQSVTAVGDLLELPSGRGGPDPLPVDAALEEAYGRIEATARQWAQSWQQLAQIVLAARKSLVEPGLAGPLLAFLAAPVASAPAPAGTVARRLFFLQTAQRIFSPGELVAPQTVELVQVSADTRTLLDPRSLAADKLTGLQLHHFGAFYKRSWRANDWMWGRLDGAGWLVHILLSPQRLSQLARTRAAGDDARDFVLGELARIAGELPESQGDAIRDELAFLGAPSAHRCGSSLPLTSLWVARALQRLIAAEELPCVALQAKRDREAGAAPEATEFERDCGQPTVTAADAERLLNECRVSEQTFAAEVGTPLLTRTLVQTAGVAVNAALAATAGREGPRILLSGMRGALRLAHTALRAALLGDRAWRSSAS
ncbi:hypothetical protein BFF78_04155 [Streptomyces fodineus]|uniref:PNPLA domain-containing protein n=1 Tax=Streptomyces fodineus TaxID=1904616 RepID=A0A1D7Y467_9ACTN|nr:patatin-like protein [Streptomyces fodineus]AOR30354.1 hypothetical protein BFF78_04155 [Streptomyces fodineus]